MACLKSRNGKHSVKEDSDGSLVCFFCGESYISSWNDDVVAASDVHSSQIVLDADKVYRLVKEIRELRKLLRGDVSAEHSFTLYQLKVWEELLNKFLSPNPLDGLLADLMKRKSVLRLKLDVGDALDSSASTFMGDGV